MMATLGNSRNLHKSKMAARTHMENKLSGHLPWYGVLDVFSWVLMYAEYINL